MKLHAIKAFQGDCLLLETGDAPPRYVLVDGGPARTYEKYARDYLRQVLGTTRAIDLAVVSHVDTDHIIGVLDLFADMEQAAANMQPSFTIGELWHNSFSETVDNPAGDIVQGIQTILDFAGAAGQAMSLGQVEFLGISDGARLVRSALRVDVPVNKAFGGAPVAPDSDVAPVHQIGSVRLRVVGPTKANLAALRKAWLAWLKANIAKAASGDPAALANIDKSIPNLSSIVLLAEGDGRRILLTGDSRGDHIIEGLGAVGLLDAAGTIDLDVLKVQHHGSDRNTDQVFFTKVRAKTYVISANGKYGNPDLETLQWIVEAAKARGEPIEIAVTNDAPALPALQASHPPAASGYTLRVATGSAIIV